MKKFPFTKQMDAADCGPSCLKMVAEHYGKQYSLDILRDKTNISRLGVSMLGISEAAEALGFRTTGVKTDMEGMLSDAALPCIVHWNQNHFIVVHKIEKNKIYVADPGFGLVTYSVEEFAKGFLQIEDVGLVLFLTPTSKFFNKEDSCSKKSRTAFRFLFSYLKSYYKYFIQLFLGMLAGSVILVVTPFLSQALVDQGVIKQNIGFIYIVFISQIMLFLGSAFIEVIRSWILLHLGTRINITIISDFIMKLLKLPMNFYSTKMVGDILQRIEDHERIKRLLTVSTLATVFSIVNIFILSAVLYFYNVLIFLVFLGGSIISLFWMAVFLKRRKDLDFKMFSQHSINRSKLIHIIEGIEEIKNSNSGKQKRWEWESIQAKLFKISIKSLILGQYQEVGASFITRIKNLLISFIAAVAVVSGDITLGAMMAISMIVGQLSNPITQILHFMLAYQDAKIGFERVNEIHLKEEEDESPEITETDPPEGEDIVLKELYFSYGSDFNMVLKNLDLTIPGNKITAIVGVSGSGKTTLMKLLLKYYPLNEGELYLGDTNFVNIHAGSWRNKCGVVMQDGYIFSDTIAKNIALGQIDIDEERVRWSVEMACIDDFVYNQLPLNHMTRIGEEGLGLSQGQKQRLLLARALYKDPSYIFLDEATSSLDASNEKKIMNNLNDFFSGRTVLIIAHRLSTVKNADNIVVLDEGRIVEQGKHEELVSSKGRYYNLIKDQLELGQ